MSIPYRHLNKVYVDKAYLSQLCNFIREFRFPGDITCNTFHYKDELGFISFKYPITNSFHTKYNGMLILE